jgi:hypothetical protein
MSTGRNGSSVSRRRGTDADSVFSAGSLASKSTYVKDPGVQSRASSGASFFAESESSPTWAPFVFSALAGSAVAMAVALYAERRPSTDRSVLSRD